MVLDGAWWADLLENIDKEVDVKQSKKPLGIFAVGIILLAFGYGLEIFNVVNPVVSQVIFLIAVIYVGRHIITDGIVHLFEGKVKIELLITIATFGAFLLQSGEGRCNVNDSFLFRRIFGTLLIKQI